MNLDHSVEQLAINSIRTLSIDMIEKAKSGHPGLPMGAAPMAYELWTKHMKHNPSNPNWFTATALFSRQVMVPHCYTACFT